MPTPRNTLDELMKEFPQSRYQDFENLMDLAKNFGTEAVVQKLRKFQAKPSPDNKLDENEVLELLNKGVAHYTNNINKDVDELVKRAQLQFTQEHTPRAKPALDNKESLEADANPQAQAQLANNPLLRNLDEAADPKTSEAAKRQAAQNIANNPESFVKQFENAVKAEAELRLANRMKNMPRPGQRQKIEPRP